MSGLSACMILLGCGLCMAAPTQPKIEHTNKEFLKDFPADSQPVADKYLHFNHPYPAVMDNADFDRDYVADQNRDNGEWAAQMEYDILRKKVRQAEKELAELKIKMDEQEEEMKKSKIVWEAAIDEVTKATAATDAAQKLEDEEAKDVADEKTKVKAGASSVENEMSQLEKCKKNLEDAKQVLKDLLAKQEAMDKQWEEQKITIAKTKKEKQEAEVKAKQEAADLAKKEAEKAKKEAEEAAEKAKKEAEEAKKTAEELVKQQEEVAEKEHEKLEAEAQKEADELNKDLSEEQKAAAAAVAKATEEAREMQEKHLDKTKVVSAEDKKRQEGIDKLKAEVAKEQEDLAKTEAKWEKKLGEEKAEYNAAEQDYKDKKKAMADTEVALEEARKKLKKFRREPYVDKDGGVYNVPKDKDSGASAWGLSALVMAALAGIFAC